MSKDRVVDSLGRIDDDMIQSVEALRQKRKRPEWKKWGAMAACLCLIVASTYVIPRITDPSPGYVPAPNPDGTIQRVEPPDVYPSHPILRPGDEGYIDPAPTLNPRDPWTIHYNEVSAMIAANRAFIKGSFTETLTDTELAALMPSADLVCSGYALFDNYGNLLDIEMQTHTTLPESPVNIGLTDYFFGFDYVLSGAEVVSVCNGLDYRAYQYQLGNKLELSAYVIINDIYFAFSMSVPQDDLEQAKEEFQRVLECFAYYEEGKPDLSIIVPEEIPELTEQMFDTLTEAKAEPDFGSYLPSEIPAGFGDASIYRFKFQNSNFLTAMWSKGLDDLSWVVTPYTEEDAHRLTSVDDKENYDLSLYPIPRADSVPDELREIVNDPIFEAEELTLEAVYCRAYKVDDAGDTNGWRMKFSVKYGDVIVSVSTKGVDPEWVYQQLTGLISE